VTTLRAATQTTNLGRYHVVKRLAAGGMADVLLARTDGIEGFERHVVIKRIHADLSDEARYVTMFLDEARLAASLHHHNIVQVNDIGIDEGEYFFAMEYIHGEDARTLLMNASKQGELLPLEHVITIVCAAAAGLHHAHEQCGPDRTPLNIVHRDVSPANILIGFDGGVKVADFGIALAAHRKEQTQSGVLKGKVAYMSPEQCNCERVDRRSDVFSLGIVLYELATVHPCFAGDNDFMTMSAIVSGSVRPPSRLNASITPALEAIILKALASAPADRYQTADEMRLALEQYASDAGLRCSTNAVADFMKKQFGTRPLPWMEDATEAAGDTDEDDLEISVAAELPAPEPQQASKAPATEEDDDLTIPVDATVRQRPVKSTLPLRPMHHRVVMPALADPRSIEPHAVEPATTHETTLSRSIKAARRWWLTVAVVAVIASGASLMIANSSGEPAAPSRTPAERPHVTPLPAPHFTSSPVVAPVAEAAPAPAPVAAPPPEPTRKSGRKGAKGSARTTDSTKWNPNALFPK
jgi:serine/threonine protein kinase